MTEFLLGTVMYNVHQLLQSTGMSLDAYFYVASVALILGAFSVMHYAFKKTKLKASKMASVVIAFAMSLLSIQTFAITTSVDQDTAKFIISASEADVKNNPNAKEILKKYDAIASKKAGEISYSNVLSYHYDIRALNEKK